MADIDRDLARVVALLSPASTQVRIAAMAGGVSAQTFRIDFTDALGAPSSWVLKTGSRVSSREYKLLEDLRDRGLGAPSPLHYDATFRLLRHPFLVVEYVPGEPHYARELTVGFFAQCAARLQQIHRVPPLELATPLPVLAADDDFEDLPPEPGIDLGALRNGLHRARLRSTNAMTLLHGDYWPGNLVWRHHELVGVIDWEDARIGDPLYDLAIARLEFLWLFGEDAMHQLTDAYLSVAPIAGNDLPYWDLRAACRPLGQLHSWSASWPQLGREDVSEAHMRACLGRFIEAALARIA